MERRLMGRYNIPLRAIVSFTDAPTQELETMNISAGGAFFITDKARLEGSKVFMSLFMDAMPGKQIKEKSLVEIEGTVKRRSSKGMAVCFNHRHRLFAKFEKEETHGLTLIENLLRVRP